MNPDDIVTKIAHAKGYRHGGQIYHAPEYVRNEFLLRNDRQKTSPRAAGEAPQEFSQKEAHSMKVYVQLVNSERGI